MDDDALIIESVSGEQECTFQDVPIGATFSFIEGPLAGREMRKIDPLDPFREEIQEIDPGYLGGKTSSMVYVVKDDPDSIEYTAGPNRRVIMRVFFN